jgi:hypothetical protein
LRHQKFAACIPTDLDSFLLVKVTHTTDAGHLIAASGKPISFVAHPQIAPRAPDRVYARPDDRCENGASWRQLLLNYSDDPGGKRSKSQTVIRRASDEISISTDNRTASTRLHQYWQQVQPRAGAAPARGLVD